MEVKIFTDGSSLGNPGPGGYCGIVRYNGRKEIVKGGESHTTNNRMEMRGIIESLAFVHESYPEAKKCHVYSDSSLIISTINEGWKRKKNLDLWAALDAQIVKFEDISWNWIRGHNGHPENTEADFFAVAEAKKQKKK